MKILVIDDKKEWVVDAIGKQFPDAKVVWVTTWQEGLEILNKRAKWDEVWLDHDLGGIPEETIRPLIRELESEGYHQRPYPVNKFILISGNYDGNKYMNDALSKYYSVINVGVVNIADYLFRT